MKVLSIGNSFSQDAQRYLHRLAKKEGVNMKTVNLYIGGCTLRTHYLNMLGDEATYAFEFNGEGTGIKVSIRQALVSDEWDIITLQQASPKSGYYQTYTPYLEELAAYVRKYCPHAKLYVHETWAYEEGSERLTNVGFASEAEMYEAVHSAYQQAAEAISADEVIPCGTAVIKASQSGVKMHRDSLHVSFGVGRYLLALTWYKVLTGKDISDNAFDEFDVPVTEDERRLVLDAVNSVV